MTNDMVNFLNQLKSAIKEEQSDIDKYIQLSKEAKQFSLCTVAGILNDISCDERTHKHFLEWVISRMEAE